MIPKNMTPKKENMKQENKQDHEKQDYEAGFTLVEVMVVMVIIGLLIGFVVVNVRPAGDQAKVIRTQGDIRNIEQALSFYNLNMLEYPSQQSGLEALITVPSDALNPNRYPKGGYIRKLPTDPWGRAYNYRYPAQNSIDVDIFSYGADGVEGGEGINADIANWDVQ